jgi:serine/threonine-protein kinase
VKTLHQSLGRYLIEAEIGRGAMGVVFRAFDPQIQRQVAIKTISVAPHALGGDLDYQQRFQREVHAAGRLSHPGIVTIFDAGEDPESGDPYLVMEYVSGEPLSKVLSRDRKLPLPLALQYAQEIAEALDYAHNQGVIHRDIKPANILITPDGHAKITDFGVAWLNREMASIGEIVGSPAYMAPEQMAGKPADARSDLFSLGVVLYSMVTGFRPFQGNSAKTVCFKIMNIEPVPVTSFQSDIPPELDAIVSRAIAKNPEDRFASGAVLARELQAFRDKDFAGSDTDRFLARVAQDESAWESVPLPPRNRGPWPLVAASLAVLVAAGVFVREMTRARNVPLPPAVIAAVRPHPIVPKIIASSKQRLRAARLAARRLRPHESGTPETLLASAKMTAGTTSALGTPTSAGNPAVAKPNTAKVQVEIEHHFNSGIAFIWLDDTLVSQQKLHGDDQRHPLLRAVEVDQVLTFQFAVGKHWLQVRIVSPENNYDQIETLQTQLLSGSQHVLHVNCDKRKMQVSLE